MQVFQHQLLFDVCVHCLEQRGRGAEHLAKSQSLVAFGGAHSGGLRSPCGGRGDDRVLGFDVRELMLCLLDDLRNRLQALFAGFLDNLRGCHPAPVRLPMKIRHEQHHVAGIQLRGNGINRNASAKRPHVPSVDFRVGIKVPLALPKPRLQ